MQSFTRIVASPLLVLVIFAGPAQAQQSSAGDQVIRVNVNLVQLDVQVLQKKTGRPIGSLSKDDFKLYEDGVEQRIAQVSRDQLPLSVVLLFDLTFSVQPVLKPLAAGALNALEHLKPEDEVAVMVYSSSAQLLQGFTRDRSKVVAAIKKASEMESGDAAYFNQAVFQSAEQLGKATNPSNRRTIIWFTDNVPNIPSDNSTARATHSAKFLKPVRWFLACWSAALRLISLLPPSARTRCLPLSACETIPETFTNMLNEPAARS